ncbi:MAG: hypothetical protein IPO43_00030 [Rhodoferax sp.]|nr:hypothetical protein [Rhodoferax sp.]
MQSHYPERFDREMGCTEREWLDSVPRALGQHAHQFTNQALTVQIGTGQLRVSWEVGEPRVIALARIPRLLVHFGFSGLDDAQRLAFMQRFDLYMQRGGG